MIWVSLSKADVKIISDALKKVATDKMQIAAKRRKVIARDSKVQWYPQNLLEIDLAAINLVEEYAARILALKEGTFDKILKNTKEVENDA